jgi:hypothetical protein
MENTQEFWMLLLIALAQRVYELEQRLEQIEQGQECKPKK